MANLVSFYAVSEQSSEHGSEHGNGQYSANCPPEHIKAAELAYDNVKRRKKTTVLCASKADAEAFDDFIWQYPADKFIPHNLYGEGPDMGTPVEILWLSAYARMAKIRNTDMLIILSNSFFEAQHQAKQIIDFVPVDEQLKAQARERYKLYKRAGCQLEYTGM